MRYSSGSVKVDCPSLRTTWGSRGCAAPATRAAVHSDSNTEDFMMLGFDDKLGIRLMLVARQTS